MLETDYIIISTELHITCVQYIVSQSFLYMSRFNGLSGYFDTVRVKLKTNSTLVTKTRIVTVVLTGHVVMVS